MTLLKISQK